MAMTPIQWRMSLAERREAILTYSSFAWQYPMPKLFQRVELSGGMERWGKAELSKNTFPPPPSANESLHWIGAQATLI